MARVNRRIRNQTQQRTTEEELERLIGELRAALESTADGILVADLDDAIRGYNNHFAELWQLPGDLLTHRNQGYLCAPALSAEKLTERFGRDDGYWRAEKSLELVAN